jgi:glutaredoxin
MLCNLQGGIMFRELLLLLLLVSPLLQAGEVYRWTDERGGVQYSDQPPPPSARQVIKVKGKGNVVDVDKESYESRLARDVNPVVLYASTCGPVCDQASDYLTQRGIPFTLKDPSKDLEAAVELKKLVGAVEVPAVRVGKRHTKGFDASSWGSLLDAAGYPKTPLIPSRPNTAKQP